MPTKPKNSKPAPEPLANGEGKKPITPEGDPTWRHIKVLFGIAVIWAFIFILMIFEKAAEIRMVLPIVSLVFVLYLAYAGLSVLFKRK